MATDEDCLRDRGSGTVLVLSLVGVVSLLMTVTLGLGAVISARHRAASAADLAALAAIDSAEGCPGALRIATANDARLAHCEFWDDSSVVVTVMVEVPGLARDVRGSARAGPGPAQMSATTGWPRKKIEKGMGASQ